jgi:hypothetical protein
MEAIAATEAEKHAQVLRMAKAGMPEHQMAFSLSVSIATLRLFYRDLIQDAEIEVNLEILETLQRLARSEKSITATIFWARTRCGFVATTKTANPIVQDPYSSDPGHVFVIGPNGEKVGPR